MSDNLKLDGVSLKHRSGFSFFSKQNSGYLLKNISLEIPSGQVLGIAGRNGAGKSTLLKLIAKVYKPSEGVVTYPENCVPMLMSLHAGFMGHLSGFENVKLLSMLYGLDRDEANQVCKQVHLESGLNEKFFVPVCTYSSGMQARLSFTLATSLESDLLLVDETLSVGDQKFRKTAMEKMKLMVRSEKTVVLVSHNLATLKSLSDKIAILDYGELKGFGDPSETIETYKRMLEK